jgi:4-carboxymuconolactone decarboxylase
MRTLMMTIATTLLTAGAATAQGTSPAPRVAPPAAYDVSPPLAAYTDNVLFGDNWRRPQLAPRDRSIVTLTTLITNGRAAQLRGHLNRAFDNGVTPVEISEMIAHLAFYSGWPTAISAVPEVKAVFEHRGIGSDATLPGDQPPLALEPASEQRRRATVDASVGDVVPGLAGFTNETLFGDLWRRPGLAPRDRSLVTVVSLIANGQAEQMPFHLNRAMDAGMTAEQLAEVVTHAAFYAGCPRAMSAVPVLKKTIADRTAAPAPPPRPEDARLTIERRADNPPAPVPASNFTGTVHLGSRFKAEPTGRVAGGVVDFQPGARTNWHQHPRGQTLIVLSGEGWVQMEGGPVETIRSGDVVWIPPHVRHWHGASTAAAMSHVAIAEAEGGLSTTWLQPVTDAEYRSGSAG